MKSPPYHLRTNKAIDRSLFIDVLRHIIGVDESKNFTYYGFGGPFLNDFQLIHEHFPAMKMISYEIKKSVIKRQIFHRSNRNITAKLENLSEAIPHLDYDDFPCIFWLDYTTTEYSHFNDFGRLVETLPLGSIIKITLRANIHDYTNIHDCKCQKKKKKFLKDFKLLLDDSIFFPDDHKKLIKLLRNMLKRVTDNAVRGTKGLRLFQPVSSFYYKDGAGIMTLTGVVSNKTGCKNIKKKLKNWKFKNLNWDDFPREINVPYLSTKERLHLQKFMPRGKKKPETLLNALRYPHPDGGEITPEQMKQYSDYYLHYPHFIQAFL